MVRESIIKNLVANKNVLDIGSVGQTDEYSLWNLYKTVNIKSLTGIDLPNIQNEAQKVFEIKQINTDEKIVYGNMETYKFEKQFDVIVAGDVIEHVFNQGLFLSNIHNHLTNDGQLVITTPNAKWPTVFFKPNPTHTFWHDAYTLEYTLNQHGFKIDKLIYYYGNKKNYNWLVRPLVLKQSILAICSKFSRV